MATIKKIKDSNKEKIFINKFVNNPKKWYDKQIEDDFIFEEELQEKIVRKIEHDYNDCKYINGITKNICLLVVKLFLDDKEGILDLYWMPYQDEDFLLECLKLNPSKMIKKIKPNTTTMQLYVIENVDADNLYEVYSCFTNPNYDVKKKSLIKQGVLIENITDCGNIKVNDELVQIAFKTYPNAIKYMENPTQEQCEEAIHKNGRVLYDLMRYNICDITDDLKKEAIKSNMWTYDDIRDDTTGELLLFLVQYHNPIKSIQDEIDIRGFINAYMYYNNTNPDIINKILMIHPEMITSISSEDLDIVTKDTLEYILSQADYEYMNKILIHLSKILTPDLYLIAIKNNIYSFFLIPKEVQTEEMIDVVFAENNISKIKPISMLCDFICEYNVNMELLQIQHYEILLKHIINGSNTLIQSLVVNIPKNMKKEIIKNNPDILDNLDDVTKDYILSDNETNVYFD